VAPALLGPVGDPLGDLVSRHARTHGPFHAGEAAGRVVLTSLDGVPGRPPAEVAQAVGRLLAREPEVAGRPVVVEEVDGGPADAHPMGPALVEAGFLATPSGHIRRPGL
jgi:hypothetical protein